MLIDCTDDEARRLMIGVLHDIVILVIYWVMTISMIDWATFMDFLSLLLPSFFYVFMSLL